MNDKLLIVFPVCANDGPLAERALDFLYKLHGKKQVGHILIVANADLHGEMRSKLRVTAELAFESVSETIAPQLSKELANHKIKQMNNLFRHAALTAQTNFRWPWLWLEPDCVPLKPDWIAQLAEAYDAQPRKYLGMVSKNANDKKIMARCGVYYGAASYELDKLCQGESPFATACADKIVESATGSPLVDYLAIESAEDIANISPKAVICHGDKAGIFAENWSPLTFKECEEAMKRIVAIDAPPEFIPAMKPQEVAKEINEFLEKPEAVKIVTGKVVSSFGDATVTKEHVAGLGEVTMIQTNPAPRTTRRQRAETLDKEKRDLIASNGGKATVQAV